jgi:hypothetical protein
VIVIRRLPGFNTRQIRRQLSRLVDQDRQVLRADPMLLGAELEQDERDFVAGALAIQADWRLFGHMASEFI